MLNKIKLQKNKIDALEKKCQIIKQNIEFQKKKTNERSTKNVKDDKNNEEENEYGDNVEKMEEAEKNLIIGFV